MGCDLGKTGIAVTSEGDKFSGKEITISYRIVTSAQGKKQIIALEDLTGIRDRTNKQPRSKQERRLSNSWAFFQLRQFLVYKAISSRA